MRLSSKNLLLILGVVVAIVVTLTTIVYRDQASTTKREMQAPAPKKTSQNSTAHRILKFLSHQVQVKATH